MCNPLQMGVLASAALVGLDDATERMRVDHEHAKALAKGVGDSLCPKREARIIGKLWGLPEFTSSTYCTMLRARLYNFSR